MNELTLKCITEENLPLLMKMCTDSFETERGIVPDEIMPDNFGEEFKETVERNNVDGWAIYDSEKLVGGAAIVIGKEDGRNVLELFFIDKMLLGHGYGTKAWKAIEKQYPDTKVWETFTPISLKKNLAFYVNQCGFKITRIDKSCEEEWDCIFEKMM